MKKICVLPGVGYHFPIKKKGLVKHLEKKYPEIDIEFHDWQHQYAKPDMPWKETWWHHGMRAFSTEVMYDYQQAIKYAFSTVVPRADLYIGHSAGSIISLAQYNKPCIIFGSPATISQNAWFNDKVNYIISSKAEHSGIARPVLNIVNKYDVLSYPLQFQNVENVTYKKHRFNPIAAHLDYWKNPCVYKMVDLKIKEWLEEH
jgi:hypothetical protein